MPTPQPGEIWEVSRLVQSPLEFSSKEQQTLYSSSVQRFLANNSPPRYVMIVKDPEPLIETQQWLIVSVMMFSVKTDLLSDVDLLIPAKISGLDQDLLAETWHIIPALSCNLLQSVGKRISRQIYDYLLTVGDYYHGLIDKLPPEISEIHRSLSATKDSKTQDFHEQEKAWSDVLTLPVAAYHTYFKSEKFINAVLDEALILEQD